MVLKKRKEGAMMKKMKWFLVVCMVVVFMVGCSGKAAQSDQVIVYSNADEEAIAEMKKALDANGLKGQYIIQAIGTSELGGKMIAEGNKMEADVVTMASYFIDTAQQKHDLFVPIEAKQETLIEKPAYANPILGNMGAIFVNTELLKSKNLPMPTSIKDLTKPMYKNLVAIPNIMDSSTGWLLVQAILGAYGEKEGQQVLKDLITNVGPHLESSGSGPIKKVLTGEVAVGFGLRAQAVKAKAEGKPIQYIDPTEGNYALTESVAVVRKGGEKEKKAEKVANVITEHARAGLLTLYPVALYKGETVDATHEAKYAKQWDAPLTVELLEQHQQFFKNAQ